LLVERAIRYFYHGLTIGLRPWRQEDWDEVPDGQDDANNEQETHPGRHALLLWAIVSAVVMLAASGGTPGIGWNPVIGLELIPMKSLDIHLRTPTFSRIVDSFSGGSSLCMF
jgi:hypothetical protein